MSSLNLPQTSLTQPIARVSNFHRLRDKMHDLEKIVEQAEAGNWPSPESIYWLDTEYQRSRKFFEEYPELRGPSEASERLEWLRLLRPEQVRLIDDWTTCGQLLLRVLHTFRCIVKTVGRRNGRIDWRVPDRVESDSRAGGYCSQRQARRTNCENGKRPFVRKRLHPSPLAGVKGVAQLGYRTRRKRQLALVPFSTVG